MVLTFKEKFNKRYGFEKDTPHNIKEISKITGFTLAGLQTIYNKGIGAFSTNPQSVRKGLSKEAWAISRVYASVQEGSKSAIIDKDSLIPKMGYHLMPNGKIMKGNSHPK